MRTPLTQIGALIDQVAYGLTEETIRLVEERSEIQPTLVINTNQVSRMLSHSLPHWNVGNEFAVLGIVNMDAVPEDERDVPLGMGCPKRRSLC